MNPIGGFFELEKCLTGSRELHVDTLQLSLGRVALRVVLDQLRPQRIWVPFYTCKAVLESVAQQDIPHVFYALNERLEPALPLSLKDGEYAVLINYFGLNGTFIGGLTRTFRERIIIDNTQAFFEGPSPGTFSFNSARKFFGVPDGSYLYSPRPLAMTLVENPATSLTHLMKRAKGDFRAGYAAFLAYEESLSSEVKGMSRYTQEVLGQINYVAVRQARRRNFMMYHQALAGENQFDCALQPGTVPFCYPFVPESAIQRERLHGQGIFVPTFWPEVLDARGEGFRFERDFARRLLPLPVDHRYGAAEIRSVIEALTKCRRSKASYGQR